MPTKAKINWAGNPYGETLRLSHTNNHYQSMLPREVERLIQSYLVKKVPKERRKAVLQDMLLNATSARFADGQYYFSIFMRVWTIKKTIPLSNRCIYYATNLKYIAKDWLGSMHANNLMPAMSMSMVEEEIKEKRQQRIKLLGTLPLE